MPSSSNGREHSRAEHFLISMASSISGSRRGAPEERGVELSAKRIAEFLAEKGREGSLETVLGVVEEALEQEDEFLRPAGTRIRNSEADPYYWG